MTRRAVCGDAPHTDNQLISPIVLRADRLRMTGKGQFVGGLKSQRVQFGIGQYINELIGARADHGTAKQVGNTISSATNRADWMERA